MGTGADGNWHRVHLWGKTLSHFIGTSLAASFSQMCFLTHFPPSLKSPHKWCISYRSDTCMMHFVWSLLLGKIIKILPILKGVCKLLTSTVCIYIYIYCIYIYIYIYIYIVYIYIYIYCMCIYILYIYILYIYIYLFILFYIVFFENVKEECCGSVVEHCVSSAKVVGSIPRKHMYWQKYV